MAKASMGKDSDMAPATLNETGLSGTPSTPGPFIAGLGTLQPAAGSDHVRAITPADLQSAREARRWTRLDVARQTKFQVRQITALEEGRFDELPGRAFVRAALRNYGQLLGLDVRRCWPPWGVCRTGAADRAAALFAGRAAGRHGRRVRAARPQSCRALVLRTGRPGRRDRCWRVVWCRFCPLAAAKLGRPVSCVRQAGRIYPGRSPFLGQGNRIRHLELGAGRSDACCRYGRLRVTQERSTPAGR